MRRWIVRGCVVLALIAPACGLGDKEQQATLIQRAYDKVIDTRSAVGVLSVQLEPGDRPNEGGAQGVLAATTTMLPKKEDLPSDLQAVYDQLIGLRTRVLIDAKVALDFPAGRAKVSFVSTDMKQGGFDVDGNLIMVPGRGAYVFPLPLVGGVGGTSAGVEGAAPTTAQAVTSAADANAEPTSIWADDSIFLKRAEHEATEKRVWAKLDWTKIDEDEQVPSPVQLQLHGAMINIVNTINPLYVLELALGRLTGSIEIGGVEQVAGVQTTRYDVRIAPEKVAEVLELDDDATALRALMLRLLRVDGNDVMENAHIWIDEEGRLRKIQVELHQAYERGFNNIVVIILELPELGALVEIPVPVAEETVELERYGQLLRAGGSAPSPDRA